MGNGGPLMLIGRPRQPFSPVRPLKGRVYSAASAPSQEGIQAWSRRLSRLQGMKALFGEKQKWT